MPIRLLISDLDGTLLGPEGCITPPTAEALQRARRAVSLPPAAARQAVAVLGRYGLGFEVNTDVRDFTTDTGLYPTAQAFPQMEDFWARQPQVRKIFAFSKSHDALARARRMLQTQPDVTVSASAP